MRGSEAPELKKWFERIETFKRDWFLKFEAILHQANLGPMWMRDERVAGSVAESLHVLDGKAYRLDSFSVMSNHIHTMFKPFVAENNLREIKADDNHPLFISDYPGPLANNAIGEGSQCTRMQFNLVSVRKLLGTREL